MTSEGDLPFTPLPLIAPGASVSTPYENIPSGGAANRIGWEECIDGEDSDDILLLVDWVAGDMNAGLKPFLIAVLLRGDIGRLADDDDAVARSAIANDDNTVGVMAAFRFPPGEQ